MKLPYSNKSESINQSTFYHHPIFVNAPTPETRIRVTLVFRLTSIEITNRLSPVRLAYATAHLMHKQFPFLNSKGKCSHRILDRRTDDAAQSG